MDMFWEKKACVQSIDVSPCDPFRALPTPTSDKQASSQPIQNQRNKDYTEQSWRMCDGPEA